jgi:hypothetical protein
MAEGGVILKHHDYKTARNENGRFSVLYESNAASQFTLTEKPVPCGSIGLDSDKVWRLDADEFERLYFLMHDMYGTLHRAGLIGPQPQAKP